MTHTPSLDWWRIALVLLQLSPTWPRGILIAKGTNSKSNSSKSLVDCLQQFNYFCWWVIKIDDYSFLLCAGVGGSRDHAFGFSGFPWFTDQICVQCGFQLAKVAVARGEHKCPQPRFWWVYSSCDWMGASHLLSWRCGKDAPLFSLSPHQRAGLSCACDLAIMVSPLNAASGGDTGLRVGEPSAALT